MARDTRTLSLKILADIDDLKKKLDEADGKVQSNSERMSDFGKKVAGAFAVAAAAAVAYATKLAVDGVKAAIEDEAAQLRLANALRTATGATDAQIKATESYISNTALAVGIADDELRPAFQRLATATGNATKAQDLMNLAIDVSKGTGKDLGAVVEALSKSYNGQDTQLVRLGIGLTAAQAKTMSFKDQTQLLSDLYGGAASRNAETFQGRIDRLRVGFDEAKEAVGAALLPVIERLIAFVFEYGTPIVDKFRNAFNIIRDAIERNRDEFNEFWVLLKDKVFPILQTVFGFLLDVGAKAASAIIDAFGKIVGAITPVLNFIIDAINTVIRGINLVKGGSDIGQIGRIGSTTTGGFSGIPSGGAGGAGGAGITLGGLGGGGGTGGISGGAGGGGGSIAAIAGATSLTDLANKLVAVQDKITDVTFATMTGGLSKAAAQQQLNKLEAEFRLLEKQTQALVDNPQILINVSAIDAEGAARAVAKALNTSAARSTAPLSYQAIKAAAG